VTPTLAPTLAPFLAPTLARAAPGDVLQAAAFPDAPAASAAWRITYASAGLDGRLIAVSALIIVPEAPPPPGGRNVVAWLHPTTGVAQDCAPTSGPHPFEQIQGLQAFLDAGYAVVATDYPGLGAPGIHPYLVGVSEGRAALDLVRAAQRFAPAGASPRFALWGHSQGGHAALFAASLARSYAPELRLVGIAAAAPAVDLDALLRKPGDNPLWGTLLSYTVWSWARIYGLPEDGILPRAAQPVVARTAAECLETRTELDTLIADTSELRGVTVAPDPRWRDVLRANTPKPDNPGVPVFLAQGGSDPVIPDAATRAFAKALCRAGARVRYDAMPDVDHYTAAVKSAPAAANWIVDRFIGRPARDDCAGLT